MYIDQNVISMAEMSNNKRLDNQDMRKLLFKKYIIEGIITIVVFLSIFLGAYYELIDKAVTGTLLGTAIGYCLKNPRKYQSNSGES